MTELGASAAARENVETLADLIDAAERGLVPGSDDTDAWQNRVAHAILASNWLAAHDEKVRAAERERLAAEAEVLADRLGALADDSHVAPDDWNAGWQQGMHEAAKMARGDD